MPNLSDSATCAQFIERLEACEAQLSDFDEFEQGFIQRLREWFDTRENALDLGMTPWNPGADQWNRLTELATRVGWTYQRRGDS